MVMKKHNPGCGSSADCQCGCTCESKFAEITTALNISGVKIHNGFTYPSATQQRSYDIPAPDRPASDLSGDRLKTLVACATDSIVGECIPPNGVTGYKSYFQIWQEGTLGTPQISIAPVSVLGVADDLCTHPPHDAAGLNANIVFDCDYGYRVTFFARYGLFLEGAVLDNDTSDPELLPYHPMRSAAHPGWTLASDINSPSPDFARSKIWHKDTNTSALSHSYSEHIEQYLVSNKAIATYTASVVFYHPIQTASLALPFADPLGILSGSVTLQ